MKRILTLALALMMCATLFLPVAVYADGDPNIGGGGGDMGNPINGSSWSPGNDGVRVTIVTADGAPVTAPIDYTNKSPTGIRVHFGKVSKLHYRSGQGLSPSSSAYVYRRPSLAMPRIISSGGGNNIEAIRRYFCSEYTIKMIANDTGMNYDTLINGTYKIVIEPIAYVTYKNVFMAMTAHEAALYDEVCSGQVRYDLQALTHQNLPYAIFLEYPELGYPAWGGSTSGITNNATIKSSLGIGIVRFKDLEPPSLDYYDYTYRVDTDVITSVLISGGQSDPDNPVSVSFYIRGSHYTVDNVYYPEDDAQLAWVKWHTPDTPCEIVITVSVTGSGGADKAVINVKVEDLDANPPPNPVADDRNDGFSPSGIPSRPQKTSASWTIWRPRWKANWVWHPNLQWVANIVWVADPCASTCPANCPGGHGHNEDHGSWVDFGEWVDEGEWEFDLNNYSASMSASMGIRVDEKSPTGALKSGYGINQTANAGVSTNQSTATTIPQNAVSYFAEFNYTSYWRLLQRMGGGRFEFKPNEYSTFNRRTHFTPVWYPDGSYTVNTWIIDCWTPEGMLSLNLSGSLSISGSVWDDWHIAPQK